MDVWQVEQGVIQSFTAPFEVLHFEKSSNKYAQKNGK